jgi:hypothetical protein
MEGLRRGPRHVGAAGDLSDDVKEQAARVRDIALAAGARTSAGAALALPPNSTGPSTAASATACSDGRRSAAR